MRPCEAHVTQGHAGGDQACAVSGVCGAWWRVVCWVQMMSGVCRVWCVRYSVCGPASQLNGVWGFRSPQIVIALCPWG